MKFVSIYINSNLDLFVTLIHLMHQDIFKIHKVDAREINTLVNTPIVDVTITSPPYFDMKDYGYKEQIGYGQSYEDYLSDLVVVFNNVFNITKDTGTLWVIIDAFRKNGEVIPLPFDFANRIREIGWKLQEVIIWGKDRTVPWAHKGQMRNSFEYVLMFSKSNDYNFYIDKVRDYESLKKWWVKYPERYNPRGKTPEAIWDFPIPTQGSWGNGYIKHFCPLPEEMIAQILKLTTNEEDVVLDPFSGTGAVLSKADNMKRKFIGTELNPEYINMFLNYLTETGNDKRREYELDQTNLMKQDKFERLILELRALKHARLLYNELIKLGFDETLRILVESSEDNPTKPNSLIVVNYYIFLSNNRRISEIQDSVDNIISKPPLSKFGIQSNIDLSSDLNNFLSKIRDREIFVYTKRDTHKFVKRFDLNNFSKLNKTDVILSDIKVELNEKDFE